MGVGDNQDVWVQGALYAIQGFQRLPSFGPAYNYGLIAKPVQVEGVERLVKLQHHVVGDVDHVVDRAHPGFGETVLQPLRRIADADTPDDTGGIAGGQVRVGHRYGGKLVDGGGLFLVACLGFPNGLSGYCRHFVSYAQNAVAVQAVGGHFQVEDGVSQVTIQRCANGSLIRQDHDAFVTFPQAQLQLGADHAL